MFGQSELLKLATHFLNGVHPPGARMASTDLDDGNAHELVA